MKATLAIARETFLRLSRDKIFVPAVIVGALLIFMSGIASYWGVEEFFKILFDLGTFSYQLIGVSVAIFWGVKLISDSKQEGSIELELASPIHRSQWILGKFLGLAATLAILAICLIAAWQLVFWAYGMGLTTVGSMQIFGLLSLVWLVVAAMAILFASISSPGVALFASLWMFICGLLAAPVLQTLSPEAPAEVRNVLELATGLWDLHRFNLRDAGALRVETISWEMLSAPLSYGVAVITFFLSLACLFFQNRELHS